MYVWGPSQRAKGRSINNILIGFFLLRYTTNFPWNTIPMGVFNNNVEKFWRVGVPNMFFVRNCPSWGTLKSLIEEHARLDFSDFLSTLLAIFHLKNKKFHRARLWTYLVKKQAEWNFSQPCSFILVCSSIRDFRVAECQQCEMPSKYKQDNRKSNFSILNLTYFVLLYVLEHLQ